MINLNTNLSSLTAQRSLTNSTYLLNQAIERMSTGFKINYASDNAANYSISTNMSTKIGAYQVAEDNVAMGLDLLSTANGSLDLISDKLSRLRALAEQASNGTYGERSLKSINTEANAIVDEMERIYSTAEYNGIKIFGTSGGSFIEEVKQRDTSSMTKLSSVDPTTTISSGTYSISTAEELAKLAEMTNNGKVTGGEFVLANNIDLSAYSSGEGWTPIGLYTDNFYKAFRGTFDGNGYVVSNLYINRSADDQGLFGYVKNGSIKNLGVENVDITGNQYVGALCGRIINGAVSNCYSTGRIKGGSIGGLVGMCSGVNIAYCYSNCNLDGSNATGGLIGRVVNNNGHSVENCYATGNISAINTAGGFIGQCVFATNITRCYATGNVSGNDNANSFIGACSTINNINISITDCYATGSASSGKFVGTNNTSAVHINQLESSPRPFVFDTDKSISTLELNFQAGINAKPESQILLNTEFSFDFSSLRGIGLGGNHLEQIDNTLNMISAKQTELGAAENRLESALEEISTQYDNLVSSRSTLRDADVAEVSSKYIRQQILQQASATLLATANQSPALALQLL